MNELIQIEMTKLGEERVQTVNARELHRKLEVRRDFSNWVKGRIEEAQLVEGQDYVRSPILASAKIGGQGRIEYYITLDAAKHLAMLERTEIGRQVRQYFIDVEKSARQALTSITDDPLVRLAMEHVILQREQQRQAIELAEHRGKIEEQRLRLEMERAERERQEQRIERQEEVLHSMEAKTDALLEGHQYYTIAGYARKIGIPMPRTTAQKLGYKATAVCRNLGYEIQQRPHPDYAHVNSYHEVVLQEVFREYIEGE